MPTRRLPISSGGFARVAVLVKTMAGKLQVQRHGANDPRIRGFLDEAAALAYAAGEAPTPTGRFRFKGH